MTDLTADERLQILQNGTTGNGIKSTPEAEPSTELDGPDGLHLTDIGNADRLVAEHGDEIRYVAAWGRWYVWDGTRYQEDPGGVLVQERAKSVPAGLLRYLDNLSGKERDRVYAWAKRSEARASLTAMIELARSSPGVFTNHEHLDADRWLLNVENGVLDLRGGRLLHHDPDRLITKLAPVRCEPEATAPTWDSFLADVLPDPEVRKFVQKAVGYSLTGDVSEQVMVVMIGTGANGKSTFLGRLERLLGDYAVQAPKDLLLATRHEPHPTSMTQLHGARFASAVETESTSKFAEAQVKQLTGGDRITARRMREDFWAFDPTHKLWLAANHYPRIHGRDDAIWRRMRVIPFGVTIAEKDRDQRLDSRLDAELPGILNWAIEGCRLWRAEGLKAPAPITAAVDEYRREQDWFVRFCADTGIEFDAAHVVHASVIADKYAAWCKADGAQPVSGKELAAELRGKGATSSKSGSARTWKGIWCDT